MSQVVEHDLKPGQILDHYRIVEKIGAGGMGTVYRAHDARLGRAVAVKVISARISRDPDRMRRFEQEARLAASLNHPNIVGLFDAGLDHDPPYFVSELIAGESLRACIARGPVPLRKAVDIAAQIVEGLAAAHSAGVIHRDIKPENVMLTPDGRAKILDFGLACLRFPRDGDEYPGQAVGASEAMTQPMTSPSFTSPGMIVGTAAYMSPEQAAGQGITYHSDQFSIGLVLHEMLTGRKAFARASAAQTMAAIIEDEAEPLLPAVPQPVHWVLGRCLEKDPQRRYAATVDLARELRVLQNHIADLSRSSGKLPLVVRLGTRRVMAIVSAGVLALLLLGLVIGRLADDPHRVNLDRYRQTPFATMMAYQWGPSWSPDGRTLAYVGRRDENSSLQVYVHSIDAALPRQLTEPPFALYEWCPRLLWTPDSRELYSPGSDRGGRGLFRIPIGGGQPVLIQRNASVAPALSPDGQTLTWVALDSSGTIRVRFASPPEASPQDYEPIPFVARTYWGMPWAAFAPDGTRLLLVLETDVADHSCWLLPWPPAKGRSIFRTLGPAVDLAWMPDSRHVVLSAMEGSRTHGRLYLGDTRTDRIWTVLVQSHSIWRPSVNPNDQRLAYAADMSHRDVIEVPLNDEPPTTLMGSLRNEQMPALSVDGRELIYESDTRGAPELWIMDMSTESARPLSARGEYPAGAGFMTPILSPDRERYAVTVVTDSTNTDKLYVGFSKGGMPVRATTETGLGEMAATWSPDGTRLAYLTIDEGREFTLMQIRLGGREPAVRLLEQCSAVVPEWSPTGDWIAAVQGGHLVVVRVRDALVRTLPTQGGRPPVALAWAPEGDVLYTVDYSGGSNKATLLSTELATGRSQLIRDLGSLVPSSSLMPGLRVSVTPDGGSVVYSVRRARSEIWLLQGLRAPRPWYARLLPEALPTASGS